MEESIEQVKTFQANDIILDRYEVLRCLADGEHATVYVCKDYLLHNQFVTMKVLKLKGTNKEEDLNISSRFHYELIWSYLIDHPNVIQGYDYIRDGQFIAYTMEYAGGSDVADLIWSGAKIDIKRIVKLVAQGCAGLSAIHQAGIIHRDIKPENFLLDTKGDVKIIDFGIAKTIGTATPLTEKGGVLGTLHYISPEYLLNNELDLRSDIYALGLIGYELITRKNPFEAKTFTETMKIKVDSESSVLPPHIINPECPKTLSDIIMKAIERDRTKRYSSAFKMLIDLRRLLSDL